MKSPTKTKQYALNTEILSLEPAVILFFESFQRLILLSKSKTFTNAAGNDKGLALITILLYTLFVRIRGFHTINLLALFIILTFAIMYYEIIDKCLTTVTILEYVDINAKGAKNNEKGCEKSRCHLPFKLPVTN